MPGHYAMVGKYKEYYDACKRVFREKNLSASDRADSLNRLSDRFASEIDYKPLIEVIKSEYLVKDIDMAYKQWKEGGPSTLISIVFVSIYFLLLAHKYNLYLIGEPKCVLSLTGVLAICMNVMITNMILVQQLQG